MAQTQPDTLPTRRAKSRIPTFETIEAEGEFWETHSTTEFEDEFEDVTNVRFILTRSFRKKSLTVRLPEDLHGALTEVAHELGTNPSALARLWIAERLSKERRQSDKH